MMSLICIVLYHNQQKYSYIKSLSEEKKKRILKAKALREEVKGPAFWKSSLIVLEYVLIHAIKSTPEIIFHGWFLGIFIDTLVQSLLFFLFIDFLVHKYWLFKSMDAFPVTIVKSSWQRLFFKKNYFSSNRILALSDYIVPVKELQVQSSLKMISFKGMFLKFGDSIRL